MSNDRLLVIDDEPDFCTFVARVGRKLSYEVKVATTADEFKATYRRFRPTMITLDMMMPKANGIELVEWLAATDCTARVFILSGGDSNFASMAKILGAIAGLPSITRLRKPISVADLENAFRQTSVGVH